jgi:hypothetical protein
LSESDPLALKAKEPMPLDTLTMRPGFVSYDLMLKP